VSSSIIEQPHSI